jgi:uncharacterized protein
MLSQITIPKKNTQTLPMDRGQLYAKGLEHVQKLSSQIWTDYNVHDPGVTTLELLCYALTDLSYRASLPIADLLASETGNAEDMKKQFFTARQILPNRPLTLLDYRKLLIDLKDVKNAWFQNARVTYYADLAKGELLREDPHRLGIAEVNLAGLYEVKIEYADNIITDADKEKAKESVQQKLQANRNLCEDFVKFEQVDTQSFQLCAELELAPDADVTKVNAELRSQVQQYLSPSVRFYTLSEMLTRYPVDHIFDGPALDHGFIDDDELEKANLRTEIRLSDIISIIMDIAGVQAVRDIVINPPIDPKSSKVPLVNKWVIPVETGKQPKLSEISRLVFYKRNMPVVAGVAVAPPPTAPSATEINDLEIPLGTYRELADYYSFQNHFPAIYGLSEIGLSSDADEKRQALAYQLKAYLLFFDQIMANYLAQLSEVKDLFLRTPQNPQTYSYQVVNSFTEYNKIYATTDAIATLRDQDRDREIATGSDRRNRFLDHLIARFAERFHDFASTMYSVFNTSPESIIRYKSEFLENYSVISQERSLAYNYSLTQDQDLWDTDNVSGLEKRLAKLLGIRNHQRRNLGDIAYDIYQEEDTDAIDEFRFRIRKRDTSDIILSSSMHYATKRSAKVSMEKAIQAALLPSGYQRRVAADGRHYFNIIDNTGDILARRIEYFSTEVAMNTAIDDLREYLRANYINEGMYLIENILLRPEQNTDQFLPICPAPDCNNCAEIDPYSYRIHVILPAYRERFRNMNFRRFAEEVIREETPAHILPKICWISQDDMTELDKLYRNWIYLKAGVEETNREKKLTDFINKLFKVKNVYEPQKLSECDSDEKELKFILGQTSLGDGEAEIENE